MQFCINSLVNQMNSHPAWVYALAHYGKPGVAEALLRRQDEEGLDVVLHLFTLWLREERGVTLDEVALREADVLIRPWRDEVVQPLRALRRAMKGMPAPGAEQTREQVRQRVKEAELSAERALLDMLCEWLERRGGAS